MQIAVSEAKGQLTELVRRAEAGDEVILTRHGQPAVKLVPVQKKRLSAEERREIIQQFQEECAPFLHDGPGAAHAADFLYDENGLPA